MDLTRRFSHLRDNYHGFLVIYEIFKYLIYNRFVAKFVNMRAQNNISVTIDPILKIIWLIEISYTRP